MLPGQIKGTSRKGKDFYLFATNLTEQIRTIHVWENSLWITGDYVFNQFVDNKEVQFFISPDKINAVEVRIVSSSGFF